jgi:serine/threonine protein phosphatase PrpC
VATAARKEAPRMGTTLTVACVCDSKLHLAHVGDSRCYLLRGSRLEQLTEDHTVANEMVRTGVIDEERAEGTKWQHVLHKAVGGGSPMGEPQLRSVELRGGDKLLLCTDGLTKHLDDETIGDRLIAVRGPEAAAHHLVNMAIQDGGYDNVTAVVARVGTRDDRPHGRGRHPTLAGGGERFPLP